MNLKEDYIPYLSGMLSSIHPIFPFHIKSITLLKHWSKMNIKWFFKEKLSSLWCA